MGADALLFATCLEDTLFPQVARAAERVLVRLGLGVDRIPTPSCCGQPAWNSGHIEEARKVAAETVSSVAAGDAPVVICSGSCAAMIQDGWPQMFRGTPLEDKALHVRERAVELSVFVEAHTRDRAVLGSVRPRRIAYHDSCHMLRMLGVSDEVRALLGRISGLEVVPLSAQERCCGFGGSFAVRYPELSAAMADEKVDDLVAHSVDEVVGADLGCLMQMCSRAERRGHLITGTHMAALLDEATAG